MAGHKSIKRIICRCIEEVNATRQIAKVTSWKEGLETFRAKIDIQIMNHNGYYENEIRKKHLLRKHDIMLRYYEKTFGEFLSNYDYSHGNEEFPKSEYYDCIWICWWQGLDQAPELVKICVESIRKNAVNHRVVILTEENYKDYVDIPVWLESKKEEGIISRTHYSDVLRLMLLSKYGGVWLDSTFFCTNSQIDKYFEYPVWSIKRPDYFHASIASGYFANYSLGCDVNHRWIFQTILDFVLEYWKNNDIMIDYLFLDYLIVLAQKNDKNIAKAFNNIEPNNPQCDELHKVLNEAFDQEKWNLMQLNTSLFKLSWKCNYLNKKDGEITFYRKLLERGL